LACSRRKEEGERGVRKGKEKREWLEMRSRVSIREGRAREQVRWSRLPWPKGEHGTLVRKKERVDSVSYRNGTLAEEGEGGVGLAAGPQGAEKKRAAGWGWADEEKRSPRGFRVRFSVFIFILKSVFFSF
jgi:hypothetical protein